MAGKLLHPIPIRLTESNGRVGRAKGYEEGGHAGASGSGERVGEGVWRGEGSYHGRTADGSKILD